MDASSLHLMRRGSLRKVLPSLPGSSGQRPRPDGARSLAAGPRAVEGLGARVPHSDTAQLELCLAVEYALVCRRTIPGVYTIPSSASPLVWFGVVFVRSGYFERGVFRFTINFAETFTRGTAPDVVFDDELFHPLVSADTQRLSVGRTLAVWNLAEGSPHVWQLLEYIARVLHCVESGDAVNKPAADLYDRKKSVFAARAAQCVDLSHSSIMERRHTDDHAIVFTEYDSEKHDAVRQALLQTDHAHAVEGHAHSVEGHAHAIDSHAHAIASLSLDRAPSAKTQSLGSETCTLTAPHSSTNECAETERITGLSWVRPGTLEPFSRR